MKVTIPGGQATRKPKAASAVRIIGGVKVYGQGPTAVRALAGNRRPAGASSR